jgi:uncharacterized Zn finger protein (UPF0148 family)
MTTTTCPSCGAGLGQHDIPVAALLCPGCGAALDVSATGEVTRAEAAPPGRVEGREEFAGEETLEGVMEEIREKEDR